MPEVRKVQFELNMKIMEVQIKLQNTTPPEVWEQREVVIKEGMVTLDVAVTDCSTLFKQVMEVATTL